MHRAFFRLDDPAAGIIEARQAAIDDRNRAPRFALPGVLVLELEFFDRQIFILAGPCPAGGRE
jgi:hypothetical protein